VIKLGLSHRQSKSPLCARKPLIDAANDGDRLKLVPRWHPELGFKSSLGHGLTPASIPLGTKDHAKRRSLCDGSASLMHRCYLLTSHVHPEDTICAASVEARD
jgi:hypothetical protein